MKFSIVTICYNSGETIEETIRSVISQDYSDYEYIIIDGASTDNTMQIVNKYRGSISKCISEADKGISDAFNKGIELAEGEYITFLNSDDIMLPGTLSYVSKALNKNTDIIFGNVLIFGGENQPERIHKPEGNLKSLKYSLKSFNHPGSFTRRDAFHKYGSFSLNYKNTMDRELILRMYKGGAVFQYIDKELVKGRRGGVSNANVMRSLRESRNISITYGVPKVEADVVYIFNIVKIYLRKLAKRIIMRFMGKRKTL